MKNLDKKQAVLCHRKPLGRQRTRQRYLPQCIIGFLLLLISIAIQAQIPQELIDKARAAGMTEEQIQREIAKHRTEQTGINQIIKPATENTVSDRSHPTQQALLPLTEQRDEHKPKQPLENIVFGREIFSDKNLTFEPDLNMPTPKNYVLSAGDELLINVWGDSELNLKLSISPDGTILIPNVGPVSLSGLTIEAAENRIRQELGKIMATLDGSQPNTFVSVGLGQIRSIKVNIVGEAVAPGTYTLSSLATLFNALYAAGGVNDIGSLRNIKVYRNSKEIASLDVYDYLLNGKYETNIRLEDNDMIIIGPYEQLVTAGGKVKRDRTYELRRGETLADLLDMAGGFTGDAYTGSIRVKRKAGDRYKIATVNEEQFQTFVLQDGDSLMVDSVIPYYDNRIIISGAVWRPGEYELSPDVHTVKQLIEQASGLKGDEFVGRAQITRLNPDFTSSVIAINIVDILNGKVPDIELQKEDQLYIPSLFDLHEPYTVKVRGAVNSSLIWKNLSVNLGFSYQFGADRYNQTLVDKIENIDISQNVDRRAAGSDRWSPTNRYAKYKGISFFNQQTPVSTRFLQKLNEFVFNSVSIGYRFEPKQFKFLEACKIASLSLNASMQDIGRISSVKQERGLDYPFARSFNLSLSVLFN